MPAIQTLKKQLRGIRSTQKITKAMKTISTVKFSKLNSIYNEYSEYGKQCRKMFEQYGAGFLESFAEIDSAAPTAVIVIASNKGMCGSFNAQILAAASDELKKIDKAFLVPCGKKAIAYFKAKKQKINESYILSDVPTYEESNSLFEDIIEWRKTGRVSGVYIVYPKYINMMNQVPAVCELFSGDDSRGDGSVLFVPDRSTIVEKTSKTVLRSMFYGLVLEAAIGAQAATLMTMRSAYDTATEYCAELEGQINRKRQSAVTADVIETSAEHNN